MISAPNFLGRSRCDQNYFKRVVAKAILWRTAEKLFDALELDGYRANTVAYAIGWLAEESGRCIDLDWIWENQRVPPGLNEALKVVCEAAHEHITTQAGNLGEVSKREACWHEFREKKLSEPNAWRDELSATQIIAPNTQEESLAAEWERVRHSYIGDSRTIGELEALTGKVWMRTRRGDPIYFYAEKTWEQLRAEKLRGSQRLGVASLRGLVELTSAAAN